MNPGPLKHEAGVLTTQPQCSVTAQMVGKNVRE
jgi:hypothetical protein